MKVSIHLTKAFKGMTLHNLDLDMALALCAALLGLPGARIDAEIVARTAPVRHAVPTGARRAWGRTPGMGAHAGHGGARHATHTLCHSLVQRSTDASSFSRPIPYESPSQCDGSDGKAKPTPLHPGDSK